MRLIVADVRQDWKVSSRKRLIEVAMVFLFMAPWCLLLLSIWVFDHFAGRRVPYLLRREVKCLWVAQASCSVWELQGCLCTLVQPWKPCIHWGACESCNIGRVSGTWAVWNPKKGHTKQHWLIPVTVDYLTSQALPVLNRMWAAALFLVIVLCYYIYIIIYIHCTLNYTLARVLTRSWLLLFEKGTGSVQVKPAMSLDFAHQPGWPGAHSPVQTCPTTRSTWKTPGKFVPVWKGN